jgi:hypothetical protein
MKKMTSLLITSDMCLLTEKRVVVNTPELQVWTVFQKDLEHIETLVWDYIKNKYEPDKK